MALRDHIVWIPAPRSLSLTAAMLGAVLAYLMAARLPGSSCGVQGLAHRRIDVDQLDEVGQGGLEPQMPSRLVDDLGRGPAGDPDAQDALVDRGRDTRTGDVTMGARGLRRLDDAALEPDRTAGRLL